MDTVQKTVRIYVHTALFFITCQSVKNLWTFSVGHLACLQLSNQNQDSMGLHMQSEDGATGTRIQDFLQNLSNERVRLHSTLEDCICRQKMP